MPTITYKAIAKDVVGKCREVVLPVTVSKKQHAKIMLETETTHRCLNQTRMTAQKSLLKEEEWMCACGNLGDQFEIFCVLMASPTTGEPVVVDHSIPSCNNEACRNAAKQLVKDMLRCSQTSQACSFCNKVHESATMIMCSRCKACYYCDKNCQIAHWKAGHKKVCKPPTVSASSFMM